MAAHFEYFDGYFSEAAFSNTGLKKENKDRRLHFQANREIIKCQLTQPEAANMEVRSYEQKLLSPDKLRV